MHLLLIHQNFPGQFRDLGPAWLAAGHRLTSIGSKAPPSDSAAWDGLEHLSYSWPRRPSTHRPGPGRGRRSALPSTSRERAGAGSGDRPQRLGEALHLAEIWTETPLVVLPELWGSARALGFGFDPALPDALTDPSLFDEQNTIAAQAIEQSQAALVACHSQRASFPEPLRRKITVLPEGLPIEQYGRNPQAQLQWGKRRFSAGQALVTLVSRNLEPLRGLRQALKAWPLVLEQRPDAQLLLVGNTRPNGYGLQAPLAATHLDDALAELPPNTGCRSIHVLGVLNHADLVTLLRAAPAIWP